MCSSTPGADAVRTPVGTRSLVVAGTGPELAYWKRRVGESSGQDDIHFLGFTKEISTLLAAADALVSPTRFEPYGQGVHEAICCGLTVFVTRCAGISERFPADLDDLLLTTLRMRRSFVGGCLTGTKTSMATGDGSLPFADQLRAPHVDRHGGRLRAGDDGQVQPGRGPWQGPVLMATIESMMPAMLSQAAPNITRTRIRPSRGWRAIDLREVWRYRELLWFLTLRDIKLRYKQTALGVSWAVLQPLFTMAVFTIFFGKLGKLPSDGKPYALFVLAALLPWQLFAYALTQSSNSLVAEQRLITKVYFPRLIVPVASVLSGLVDFLVAFCLMVRLMAAGPVLGWFTVKPTAAVLAIPIFTLFAVLTALAVGLWLSALNVQYRDIRYTIPFLTQFWMFLTPVAYAASLVPPDVPPALWSQPDVRGRGRVPVGAAGYRCPGLGHDGCLRRGGAGLVGRRPVLFPADGTNLCRRGVIE